jgi:hypothetical protein
MEPEDVPRSPSYRGDWIYVDPDEDLVELIEAELDLDTLCELLRCDATEVVELAEPFMGYVDGEGEWQERQTEWQLAGRSFWGPMVIFRFQSESDEPGACSYEDVELFEEWVQFA